MNAYTDLPGATDALATWAAWYGQQGWPIFPCTGKRPLTPHGYLDASADAFTIAMWWRRWPQANIALACSDAHWVLDADPRHGSDATLRAWAVSYTPIVAAHVLSGRGDGGGHWHFFGTGIPIHHKAPIGAGLDVIGRGGCALLPPSVHPESGQPYLWDLGADLSDPGCCPAPAWLLARVQKAAEQQPRRPLGAEEAGAPILEGQREATLLRIGGAMRRQGATPEELLAACLEMNRRCVPPLPEADVLRVARSLGRYTPAPDDLELGPALAPAPDGTLPYSDTTNAMALVRAYGQDIRYCYPWNSWIAWTGTHWQRDESGTMMRYAKRVARGLAAQAKDLDDDAKVGALLRHVKASLSTAKLKALLENAQSEPGVAIRPEELDRDPWLLNCPNGTLDLRTATLQAHARGDFLTRCLATAYDAEARCPLWEAFLAHIFAGDGETIAYVQRMVGCALSGDTSVQALFVFWGSGANGKSTLVNILLALLGPYAIKATPTLLMIQRTEQQAGERADLFGMRLVAAIESDEGARLNESLVKELTGSDPIRARHLYEDFWQFDPTHKIILATNHKPIIRGTDHAIWRRVRLIPFAVVIPEDAQDPTLPEKLRAELPGILAWAVRGCTLWRAGGLGQSESVKNALGEYREDMDVLGRFIAERCVLLQQASVRTGALYTAYKNWCEENGEYVQTQTFIGTKMRERGFTYRRSYGRIWLGIGLHQP